MSASSPPRPDWLRECPKCGGTLDVGGSICSFCTAAAPTQFAERVTRRARNFLATFFVLIFSIFLGLAGCYLYWIAFSRYGVGPRVERLVLFAALGAFLQLWGIIRLWSVIEDNRNP